MRTIISGFLAVGVLAFAGAAQGDPVAECQAAASSRAEVAACLNRKLNEVEKEMDDLVALIHRQVHGPAAGPAAFQSWRSFDDAQGLFVSYRGVSCNWQFNQAGAEGSEQLRACMIRMTHQRNDELKLWLKGRAAR